MSWYKVTLPKNIVARPVDSVSYYTISESKAGKEIRSPYLGSACYAGHMATLNKYTFDCVPCNTKVSILPSEDFFLWMKFCAAFGFSPSGTIPYTKDEMNCCLIQGVGDCKHRIYAGLCCYRWAECLSPMVYEACRLIEKKPEINFYRLMHYITGKYVTLMGHSFTNVSAASMSMYSYYGVSKPASTPRLDLMWALMPMYYFASGFNKAAKANQNDQTQVSISNAIAATKLSLPVKKHEDLLDDKWDELFNLEDTSNKNIKECYDKLVAQ